MLKWEEEKIRLLLESRFKNRNMEYVTPKFLYDHGIIICSFCGKETNIEEQICKQCNRFILIIKQEDNEPSTII